MTNNDKKTLKIILIVGGALIVMLAILMIFISTVIKEATPAETTAEQAAPIYENAELVDIMSGSGKNKVGYYTLVRADKADCTDDALYDWFANYVTHHKDANYHIIAYNDDSTKGVYSSGFADIQKDITLSLDNDQYELSGDAGATYYSVDVDKKEMTKLYTMIDEDTINNAKAKIESVIPTEYKTSEAYTIDIAGTTDNNSKLECMITIVNADFETADLQSIAEKIGSDIKALNLNVGNLSIFFQHNDYEMKALSTIDDLSVQDVSEIKTDPF